MDMAEKRGSDASHLSFTTSSSATAFHSLESSTASRARALPNKRLIAIAIDSSKNAEYTVRWALKYIVKPSRDEVVFINVRPVATLAALYGQPLVELGDQFKQKFGSTTQPTNQTTTSTSPTLSPEVLPAETETVEPEQIETEQQTVERTEPTQVTFSEDVVGRDTENPAVSRRASRRASWKAPDDELLKLETKYKEESHELLRNYCARLIDRKIICRGLALVGDPAKEITSKVSELRCDMLILGARGQGAASNPLAIPNLLNSSLSGDRTANTVAAIKRAFPNTVATVAAVKSLGTVSSYCLNYCEVPVVIGKGGPMGSVSSQDTNTPVVVGEE